MNKKIAFLFPGQGAQYPGMAQDFYEAFAVARETFEEADEILSCKFSDLIFRGSAAELTLTKNSQIAIYIASIAILRTIQQQIPQLEPAVCAGLSLGEYTALTAAGKISFKECLRLVQARAQYMNDACETHPGTMQVVLGMDAQKVEELVGQINPPHLVWVANLNCPGQVVIAGTKSGMEAAAEHLKANGAKRTLPLEVSGAFHSGLMKEAQNKLGPAILAADLRETQVDLVMNVPGDYVTALEQIRQNMIQQVTSPVRWEQGIRAMMKNGVTGYLEIGCGKTLVGMNKRIGVQEPSLSIEKQTDLECVFEFLNIGIAHATIEK